MILNAQPFVGGAERTHSGPPPIESGASCRDRGLRIKVPFCRQVHFMPGIVRRSALKAVKVGPSRQGVPLPQFIPPQLSKLVEKPPSGPQWLHEIKLDGYRMSARHDQGRAQLLTRTGLDWTAKYPSVIQALAHLEVKTAYLDGELCGVDDAGLPSFAHTQAATDGESGARLVYYAFDLLHLDGRDVSRLPLQNDRCAVRAWTPRPLAQGQGAQPPRVRYSRVERSGRLQAASRGAAARILRRRRQAHLRGPCGHGYAGKGSC
jgi:ATP-dependent DNA ligase